MLNKLKNILNNQDISFGFLLGCTFCGLVNLVLMYFFN